MNEELYNVEAGTETPSQGASAPRRRYAVYETVFAFLCPLLCYLFCRVRPASEAPMGAFLFTVLLFAAGGVYLTFAHGKQNGASLCFLLSSLLFSLSFVLCADPVIHGCTLLWVTVGFFYWIYLSLGNAIAPLGGMMYADAFKAFFVMPWSAVGAMTGAWFEDRSAAGSEGGGKKARRAALSVLWILLGLGVAVIPTVVVANVLMYDAEFTALIKRIWTLPVDTLLSHLGSLILAIPLAFYLFGHLIACADRRLRDKFTAQGCKKAAEAARFVPVLMALFAVIPLLVVYALFFFSQKTYYLSAFTGVLPEGVNLYSSYAREGFFQLCGVAAFNGFVMLMITLFVRRREGRTTIPVRILSSLLALSTLILIATAISKMVLYIRVYGLTPDRVYSSWFMLLLAAAFIFVIVRQIWPRFNFTIALLSAFIVMYGALAVCDTGTLIVRYNADRYMDGSLGDFDALYMAQLGDSAVPDLIRVGNFLEEKIGNVPEKYTAAAAASGELKHADLEGLAKALDRYPYVPYSYERSADEESVYLRVIDALIRLAPEKDKETADFFSVTLPRIRARRAIAEAAGK